LTVAAIIIIIIIIIIVIIIGLFHSIWLQPLTPLRSLQRSTKAWIDLRGSLSNEGKGRR